MEYIYLAIFWTIYFIIHSVLASNRLKEYVKYKFPSFFTFYRITYNLIALSTLGLLLYYQYTIPENILFPTTLLIQIFGILMLVIGLVLALVAFNNYSGMEFLGLDFNKSTVSENQLNTTGFNKYVRHPLYFASLMIVWGYFISNPDMRILTMNIVVSMYLYIGTKLEEQKLIEEFGTQYKDYIEEVPMLIPEIKF